MKNIDKLEIEVDIQKNQMSVLYTKPAFAIEERRWLQ